LGAVEQLRISDFLMAQVEAVDESSSTSVHLMEELTTSAYMDA
jgi:hypothetical protein